MGSRESGGRYRDRGFRGSDRRGDRGYRENDNSGNAARDSGFRDHNARDRGGRDHDNRDGGFRDGNFRGGPDRGFRDNHEARDRGGYSREHQQESRSGTEAGSVAGGQDGVADGGGGGGGEDNSTRQLTGKRRKGRCKWFNVVKGWGFITPDDGGQEVFVHQHVIHMDGFRSLGENEDVEFEYEETPKGFEATLVTGPNGSYCYGSHRAITRKRSRKIRCYNCGEYGNHIAAKCKLGPMPKRCHHCKSEDHLIADCPQRFNKNSVNVTAEQSAAENNEDGSNDVNSGMANLIISERE